MVNTILESRDSSVDKHIICRLCMNHHEDSFNIFVSNATSSTKVWNIIRDLLNLEVSEDDGLPDAVCFQCLSKLLEFNEFKVMCVKSSTEHKRKQESGLKMQVTEGVIPSETLFEEGTQKLKHLGQDESQERPLYNIIREPLEMGNIVYIKQEADPNESWAEDETHRGEDPSEDEYGENGVCKVVCVPLVMGDLSDVKEEVDPFDAAVEGEPCYIGKNCDEDEAGENPMPSATDVIEEVGQNSVAAEEVRYGGENIRKDECKGGAAYVACVPLEIKNPVCESSSSRSRLKAYETILSNPVKKPGNMPVKVKSSSRNILNPTVQSVRNYSTVQCQLSESTGVVPGESCEAEHFAKGTSTLAGMNKNESRCEPMHVELQKNALCDLREYICNDCGFKCSDKTKLCIHITDHILKRTVTSERHDRDVSQKDISLKIKKSFKCEVCEMEFKRKGDLVTHSAIHNRRKQLHECEICGKVFDWKCNLMRHSVIHIGLKPFKCEICGKGFTFKSALLRHSALHSGLKPFKCDKCGKEFAQKMSMVDHLVAHSNVKPFECETCGKGFKWRSQLSRHVRSHTSSNPFMCKTCGKVFNWKNDLLKHSVIHASLEPIKCETCGKEFSAKSCLLRHSVIHAGLKPFKCKTCGKGFRLRYQMTNHAVIHTGLKPFKCEICGKEFAQKMCLVDHSKVHSNLKPFKCETCGKGFKRSSHLRRHTRLHTGLNTL